MNFETRVEVVEGPSVQASVKLIDFGSSCFASDRLSSYVQSRSYRAPEVVLGLAQRLNSQVYE